MILVDQYVSLKNLGPDIFLNLIQIELVLDYSLVLF